MGQNESGAAVLESSETVEHLEKRFLIREHPYYSDSSFKLLHEKLTNKAYALRIFCSNDEEESEKL